MAAWWGQHRKAPRERSTQPLSYIPKHTVTTGTGRAPLAKRKVTVEFQGSVFKSRLRWPGK